MNEGIQAKNEDEIDLRELWQTIIKNKKLILQITFISTVLASIYVFFAPKIYEAKTILEMGFFNVNGKKEFLDDSNRLSQALNIVFIDDFKGINKSDSNASIEKINILKNKEFIEIVAYGKDNVSSAQEVEKLLSYVQEKHQLIINEKLKNIRNDIKNIEREIAQQKNMILPALDDKIYILENDTLKNLEERIKLLKKYQLPSLDRKLEILISENKKYENQLILENKSIETTQNINPTLSALSVMEKRDIQNRISNNRLQIIDLEKIKEDIINNQLPQLFRDQERLKTITRDELLREKDQIINSVIQQLESKKEILETSIAPHNYKNSGVVSKILTYDKPVKPKKSLIVVVACVTGFILSIFIVFLLEMFRSPTNEE